MKRNSADRGYLISHLETQGGTGWEITCFAAGCPTTHPFFPPPLHPFRGEGGKTAGGGRLAASREKLPTLVERVETSGQLAGRKRTRQRRTHEQHRHHPVRQIQGPADRA